MIHLLIGYCLLFASWCPRASFVLECRSMKQLDESHISITEKHITRKLICVGWGTGKYLKDCSGIWPEWQRHKSNILMLPVRFSQSLSTIKIIFFCINKHSSWEMFYGVGTLVQKDSKVDLFKNQCKYFTNLFLYISLTRNSDASCQRRRE